MAIKRKEKEKVLIISIIIVLILVLAVSFAYFSTRLNGTDQIVKVGKLELVLDETSEGISLENAIGLSDSEGLSLTPSTFKLINNGNKAVDYTIYLDDNTISDTDTRIEDKYLKYNLNKNGTDSGATLLTSTGTNPNRIIDSGTIEGGGTNNYSLNLWITDEVDGNYSGQVFSGKLRVEVSQERDKSVASVLPGNLPEENLYDDGVDTFITGENPNNYIWYSGKLWRAVSVNNEAKTTKLVTQWNISSVPYSSGSSSFEGSYMEEWLNDTTVDGFLGNLREPDKFIVTDAKWNATLDSTSLGSITRPNDSGTVVTDTVGLLNMYEYQSSYHGTTYSNGYLNNGLFWWTLTPNTELSVRYVHYDYGARSQSSTYLYGIRPSINLKSDVKIVDGNGTIDNPYRLEEDNDTDLSGTLLSSRYSGEYITFGSGENNLYRIVSHETSGLTKITSAEPLRDDGTFLWNGFGNPIFSYENSIGIFIKSKYLNPDYGYLTDEQINMIENNTTWYIGTVNYGDSYKLAKYTNITDNILTSTIATTEVGLLRLGELMSGQFNRKNNNYDYWLLTQYPDPNNYLQNRYSGGNGECHFTSGSTLRAVKPAFNLKSNVVITSGDGTLQNPFELSGN